MKKDIEISKVTGVKLAIVQEYNPDFKSYDWNAYLINEKDKALDMVFIKTSGSSKKQKTATMRHKIDKMPSKSVAKIEFIPDDVLKLNNSFNITFFLENQLFEKNFLVKKNTVQVSTAQGLALFNGSKGFVFE
jgi:hypothetical protein